MGLVIALPPSERTVVPQTANAAWVKARIGHLTASRMHDVMTVSKRDGKPLKKRDDYLIEVVGERMTDIAQNHYVSEDMEHGLEYEEAAKIAYGQVKNCDVDPAGFILHPSIEFFGASPDAFIGADGLAEFKCPRTSTHIRWLKDGVVPEKHKAQMIAQIACTGRKWVDFCSFDPRIKTPQKIFIRRFEPTAEELDLVETQARLFLAEVEELFMRVTTSPMAA
jgi:hypothetical protein